MSQLFCGFKKIIAVPMTRIEYNNYRGWQLPAEEAPLADDAGYLVEYLDGGESNHPAHSGYISWSPKSVFDNAYRSSGELSFGHAIELIKQGHRLARKGWNGSGMFVYFVNGSQFVVNRMPLLGIYPEGTEVSYHPHVDMKTAQGDLVPWVASQTDTLADDWYVVDAPQWDPKH